MWQNRTCKHNIPSDIQISNTEDSSSNDTYANLGNYLKPHSTDDYWG